MSQNTNSSTEGSNPKLLSNTYNGFINLLAAFVGSIRKNIVLFLVCLVIPTGYLVYNNAKKAETYKATFTVSYDDLVRKIYGDRLAKINVLIQNKNYSKVAALLGTNTKVASSLLKVKGTNILGQDLEEDMNTDRIPFVVTITINDTSSIQELQNGLVNFLETGNAYMFVKKEIKLREVEEELQFINEQLNMMDTLKRKYNTRSVETSEMKTTTNSSANTIYQFSYELYKRKQELLRKKSMPATVQVLDDAIVPKSTKSPSMVVVVIGIIMGMLLYIAMLYLVIPVFKGGTR